MYNRLRLNAIPYALRTHPHNDHPDAVTLFARYEMCQVRGNLPLHHHCSTATVDRIDEAFASILAPKATFHDPHVQIRFSLQITEISPWQELTAGSYRAQSIMANHTPGLDAMLYAIEDTRSGEQLFFGTDIGSLPSATWTRLANFG